MNTPIAVLFLVLATVFGSAVQATPLEEIHGTPVSRLEFGSFKLEVALTGIKDWPFPIEGAGVSYRLNPDQMRLDAAILNLRPALVVEWFFPLG